MNKLIICSEFPTRKVKSVIISGKYQNITSALKSLKINPVIVKPNYSLSGSLSQHPDCLIFVLSDELIITDINNFDNIVNLLTTYKINCNVRIERISSPYPEDVRLNCRVIGKKILCNKKYVSSIILEYAQKENIRIIDTNQGYSACSTIRVGTNALITDDISVYKTCVNNNIDVLLIKKGSIKLDGYDYGFIGGTCGYIAKDLIAFTGKLSSHSDGNKIVNFLYKYGIHYIELCNDGPLIDVGGIIPLIE